MILHGSWPFNSIWIPHMLALVILNIIIYAADKVPGGEIQEESFCYSLHAIIIIMDNNNIVTNKVFICSGKDI